MLSSAAPSRGRDCLFVCLFVCLLVYNLRDYPAILTFLPTFHYWLARGTRTAHCRQNTYYLTSNLRWNTTSASSDFTVTTYHTTGDANQSRNDNAFCVRITSLATLGHPNTSELALKPTRLNHHEVVPDLRLFSLTSPPLLTMQWCNQVQNKQKNCDYFRSTPAPHILHVATNSQHGID